MAKNDTNQTKICASPRDLAYKKALSVSYNFDTPIVQYDDIVDTSHFKLSREIKRDMVASGNLGAGEQGVFDYKDGEKITKENAVTDTELLLRAGKLDKADVQKLRDLADKASVSDIQNQSEKQALAQAEKASKNRLAKMDEILDVNQTNRSST